MDNDAKEMYILGSLHKIHPDEKRTRYGERKRNRYSYIYEGHCLCRKAFSVIYDVSERTLQRLVKHMNNNGNVPRIHGNKGRKPVHSLKFEDVERVVQFILTYAEEKGLHQPAAPRGRDGNPPIFLKSSKTKKLIHAKYHSVCETNSNRAIQIKAFTRIWDHCCPHVKIAKPEDDVCGKCEILRKRVADAHTDSDKLQTSTELQEHILAANVEHQVYISCVAKSLEELEGIGTPALPIPPCSNDYEHCHYTFDFAQNVCLPHHARQMGPIYFLTPRKVHVFGVRDDGARKQYNYIVDEAQTIGNDGKGMHGPNGVISMLDHMLTNYSHGEKMTTLQCDKCGGQNKNRYVLAYLAWRTMTGHNTKIRLIMMMPGHARCLVDSGFGLMKKLYRRSDCETLDDIERVINMSCTSNVGLSYEKNGVRQWEWRDWKTFLTAYFGPVKGIRGYQQFCLTTEVPGAVFVKQNDNSEEVKIEFCHNIHVSHERPAAVQPAGLTAERKAYLAKKIRPYLRECNKDITCPEE